MQRLFAEVEGEEQADDDDEVAGAEEDATEIQEEVSDTEQEGDSSEEEEIAEKKGKCVYFLGRDKTSQWNKHCPSKKVRTRKANIVNHLPGVANCAKHMKSVLETWDLFFPEEILRIIVENTNKFITSISENYSRERDAMPTDIVEIKALLGLVYLRGVLKSSRLNVDELWDKNGCGVERFRLTMSKQRFLFLLRSLRFDDRLTREERKQVDKLAPIRDILDIFVKKCQDMYHVSDFVTIDEMLPAFRGRCQFKQYIPSKPNKYGIKIFSLVDAKMHYTKNLEVYVGQQPDGPK